MSKQAIDRPGHGFKGYPKLITRRQWDYLLTLGYPPSQLHNRMPRKQASYLIDQLKRAEARDSDDGSGQARRLARLVATAGEVNRHGVVIKTAEARRLQKVYDTGYVTSDGKRWNLAFKYPKNVELLTEALDHMVPGSLRDSLQEALEGVESEDT